MKAVAVLAVLAVAVVLRRWLRRRRRAGGPAPAGRGLGPFTSDVWLVAAREMRERFRGRMFKVGTVLILAVVAAAIVIPTLTSGALAPRRVGIVGTLPASGRASVEAAARSVGTTAILSAEAGTGEAAAALRSGRIDLAIVDGRELLVDKAFGSTDTSPSARFVRAASSGLGLAEAVEAAHLSSAQSSALAGARPLPVSSLQSGRLSGPSRATSVIGLILTFVMLSQYNTWILIGVMEEKASRVIEVLLAAVRPIRLLAGKVLGIGLVAFAQASLIVAFALAVAGWTGSDLLRGTAPLVVVATLVWLVLGYAFYCWVYAAAGSLAERQDQVQSLALPLSLPIIFGYIMAITVAASGSASAFFDVLAYLPPTAPFAMPVLVALGTVSWWQFVASAAISLACTVGVARLAGGIYRRAILHTGGRVKLREVLGRTAG